jgi:NADPH2:quinone reductase
MVVAERCDPVAKPGELVVKVAAAGVNFMDIYQRTGVGVYTTQTLHPGGEGAGPYSR